MYCLNALVQEKLQFSCQNFFLIVHDSVLNNLHTLSLKASAEESVRVLHLVQKVSSDAVWMSAFNTCSQKAVSGEPLVDIATSIESRSFK